jgi:riboflavin synthase
MFTGLIEELGSVSGFQKGDPFRLTIQARETLKGLAIGSSIAVNGACLTVTHLSGTSFTADLSLETLAVTNLGELQPGERVNLERPLRLGDRLEGHWVSGHVDGVGEIRERGATTGGVRLAFSFPPHLSDLLVPKGSVAVDGISLTLVEVKRNLFSVQLIPFTLSHTTLEQKRTGGKVNLEMDLMAKHIKRLLSSHREKGRESRIDGPFLLEHGYMRR